MITIDNLCNGDLTKRDYFLDLTVIDFLNLLAFTVDKQKEQKRLHDKAMRKK